MPENVEAIAREWSPRMGLRESEIASYLRENIHYTLDAECRKGLALYFRAGGGVRGDRAGAGAGISGEGQATGRTRASARG